MDLLPKASVAESICVEGDIVVDGTVIQQTIIDISHSTSILGATLFMGRMKSFTNPADLLCCDHLYTCPVLDHSFFCLLGFLIIVFDFLGIRHAWSFHIRFFFTDSGGFHPPIGLFHIASSIEIDLIQLEDIIFLGLSFLTM